MLSRSSWWPYRMRLLDLIMTVTKSSLRCVHLFLLNLRDRFLLKHCMPYVVENCYSCILSLLRLISKELSVVNSLLKRWLQCAWWKIIQRGLLLKNWWNIPFSRMQSLQNFPWKNSLPTCHRCGIVWRHFRFVVLVSLCDYEYIYIYIYICITYFPIG